MLRQMNLYDWYVVLMACLMMSAMVEIARIIVLALRGKAAELYVIGLWHLQRKFKLWKRAYDCQRYARTSNEDFDAIMRARHKRFDKFSERMQILQDRAHRDESHGHCPWHVTHLLKRAAHYGALANSALAKLEYLEEIKAEIAQAKGLRERLLAHETARKLLNALSSPEDGKASAALTQLYAIRGKIDWSDLVPRAVPQTKRDQAVAFLRLASGTTSLNEARSALGQLRRLVSNNGKGK
jgi:hypothetical protein